jgi:hypothetical protein
MHHYLAELYLSRRHGAHELDLVRSRARDAAAAVSGEGAGVLYLSSTYLPGEELLFVLYGGDSRRAVLSALERAGISHERLHRVVAL